MRVLSATLTSNQKSMERPSLLKAVLTKSGQTTQTYNIDSSANRILSCLHIEQEWSQIAHVTVISDATLAALDLSGYTNTISWGYNDGTNGDEYSACAPLEVVAQRSDTNFNKSQVQLITHFTCAGIFDFMDADRASVAYSQEDTDTNTVKTLLTAIAEATLECFKHCKAYTINFDSEDSLIDSYIPADYFYIGGGESRLSAFKKLIRTTKCKARIEDDGEIHVFNPTVSGTTYDYQYNDAATNHNFFDKGVRKRLVIPNNIIVRSHPTHETQYSGSASDADSFAALGRYIDSEPFYIRATSDTQCDTIAAAKLQQLQVDSEKGHGNVPMNCGQEVMDYVNITDSIASDSRAGNIGYLARRYSTGRKFQTEIRFGALAAEMPFMQYSPGYDQTYVTWEAWSNLVSYVEQKDTDIMNFIVLLEKVPKWHVYEQLTIPVE